MMNHTLKVTLQSVLALVLMVSGILIIAFAPAAYLVAGQLLGLSLVASWAALTTYAFDA